MNEIVTEMLAIATSVVIITDISGFWNYWEGRLGRLWHFRVRFPKILVCSFCQSHWLNLVYLIATGNLTILNYMTVLAISVLTPVIADLITGIRDMLLWLTGKIRF